MRGAVDRHGGGGVADVWVPGGAVLVGASGSAWRRLWPPRWDSSGDARCRGGVEGGGECGRPAGAREEAERRRPKSGGAVWHDHANGDHCLGHASVGISIDLSTP